MASAAEVSIIVPAFNEVGAVGRVVAGLRERLPEAEILVVDDGSSDGTGEAAAGASDRVIRHDRCRGYGASLRTGVRAATRSYVLFCDADGQHTAEDVARVMAACDDVAMVVGARSGRVRATEN